MSITYKSSKQSSKSRFSRIGTFADLLVGHVRERGGRASLVYGAARIDRRTYSAIISHPFRTVSKRTAIQFALALRLKRDEADRLLMAAGYALSPSIPEDIVFADAISEGVYDMFTVSERLEAHGMKPV